MGTTPTTIGSSSTWDKVLVGLGASPFDEFLRVVVGFLVLKAIASGDRISKYPLALLVVGVLMAFRVIPALLRHLMPFPPAVKQVWTARRQTAKRYDSYQWKKLFWFGIGMTLYLAYSHRWPASSIIVSAVCLLSGAIGLLRWKQVSSEPNVAVPVKQ